MIDIPATNIRLWDSNNRHVATAEPIAIEPRPDGWVTVTIDADSIPAQKLLPQGERVAPPFQQFTASVDRDGKRFLGNVRNWTVRKDDGRFFVVVGLAPLARSLSNSIIPRAEYVETFQEES
jgi:hypothetical protein